MTLDSRQRDQLLAAARDAQARAYCPYSSFPVGAAVLTDTGAIVTGCNVENASYGLTICAERNAACRAIAEQAGRPLAILVVGPTPGALTPCGACRQFLAEFNPDMLVLCVGASGETLETTIRELLPNGFSPRDLDEGQNPSLRIP